MKPIWGLALLSQLATAYRGGDVLHESFKGKGFFLKKQGGVNMGPFLGLFGEYYIDSGEIAEFCIFGSYVDKE